MRNKFELKIGIANKDTIYYPPVLEGVTLTSNHRGVPSELNFTVLKTPVLDFVEGNAVVLEFNGVKMFLGYVFEKSRSDGDTISVKAYDQLRYLQCRDSIEFSPMKANEYVEYIAKRAQINYGELEDTQRMLPERVEEGTSYIDMILVALDRTKKQTGEDYILYDDFGKLTLKNIRSLVTNCYINAERTGGYTYTTSIDKDTYTKVRLVRSNGRKKDEPECVVEDKESRAKWGVLVHYEKVDDEENIRATAEELLKQYNRKTVSLHLSNVFGDPDIRAGKVVVIDFELGDMHARQFVLVTRCTHRFLNGEHFMELDVKGEDINE